MPIVCDLRKFSLPKFSNMSIHHINKFSDNVCPKKKVTIKINQPEWISTYILEIILDRKKIYSLRPMIPRTQ